MWRAQQCGWCEKETLLALQRLQGVGVSHLLLDYHPAVCPMLWRRGIQKTFPQQCGISSGQYSFDMARLHIDKITFYHYSMVKTRCQGDSIERNWFIFSIAHFNMEACFCWMYQCWCIRFTAWSIGMELTLNFCNGRICLDAIVFSAILHLRCLPLFNFRVWTDGSSFCDLAYGTYRILPC